MPDPQPPTPDNIRPLRPDLAQDLDAERAVLGALFIDPGAFAAVRDVLSADDFFVQGHHLVYGACCELVEDGSPIDPVLVQNRLAANGHSGDVVSALPYELGRGLGTAGNVRHYAGIVAGLARVRRVQLATQAVLARSRTAGAEPDEFLSFARKTIGAAAAPARDGPGGRSQPAVADLSIGAMLSREESRIEQPTPRIATGWKRVDAALGGGLEVPSLTVLGAPPKGAKSTWAQIVAVRHVEAGGVAYVLDLENGPRRFLRRVLCRRVELGPTQVASALADERSGVFTSRADVERWRAAKMWMRNELGPRLFVEHAPPLDFAGRVKAARELAGDRKLLVVVDSLQKLPAADPHDDRRTSIDKWTRLFERLRYECDAAFLVVSEIRRGKDGYAAREDAFKESGGIEYSADLAITMNRPAADEDSEDRASTLRIELARDSEEDARGEIASYRPVKPFYGLDEDDPMPAEKRGRRRTTGPVPARLEAACDALRSMLANGPMKVDDVLRCAKAEGFGRTTVYEAKKTLGLTASTVELRSAWRLP